MSRDDFLAWLRDAARSVPHSASNSAPCSASQAPNTKGLAIACSGGLDSRFLCHMALRAGLPVLALHAQGPHISPTESQWAQDWAKQRGLELRVVDFDPLALPGIADNSRERCYVCKQALVRCLRETLAAPEYRSRTWLLCDGTNADDLHAHRPGLRALQEARVLSPLAACGIGKESIRQWAQETGLEQAEQTARPCLLTRLAYGMRPHPQLLQSVAACEAELAAAKLPDFRLRLTPAPVLQSLPLQEEQRRAARCLLEKYGFSQALFVEEEALSGYFDRLQ